MGVSSFPASNTTQNQQFVSVLGVKVSRLTSSQFLNRINEVINSGGKSIFEYANIYAINSAYENSWLRDFYIRCDKIFCDGFGVRWAASFLGFHIPERFTLPDWIDRLAAQCVQNNRSLFLIGGKDSVAEKAAEELRARNPGLSVVGAFHGYFDKSPQSEGNLEVRRLINKSSPDILIVGFGIPVQERWISENFHDIEAKVFLAAGALFDYLTGNVSRGPRWMTDHGFEWLSRLAIEPRRLWKRYLIGNPIFFMRVLRQRLGLLHMKA